MVFAGCSSRPAFKPRDLAGFCGTMKARPLLREDDMTSATGTGDPAIGALGALAIVTGRRGSVFGT